MKRVIDVIRDIKEIEKHLQNSYLGIFAMSIPDDEVIQTTLRFIYIDKNVFLFFDEDDDLLELIKLENKASFTVFNSEKIRRSSKKDNLPIYRIINIQFSGIIRKIDDVKLYDDIINKFNKLHQTENGKKTVLIMIDSEEIQAYTEEGF